MINDGRDRPKKPPWLQILVHALGVLPVVLITLGFVSGRLGANPIQAIEQLLGRTALYFLIATLAVTPLATITGWHELPSRRRALGLYAFLYASLHFLIFAGLDYGVNFAQIIDLVAGKPYILAGSLAFSMLIPLALTSFDYSIRRMKKSWTRLHWLVFPSAVIVIVHFGWARKGDFSRMQGNILQPILTGLLLVVLLLLRVPGIRKAISGLRHHLAGQKQALKNNMEK